MVVWAKWIIAQHIAFKVVYVSRDETTEHFLIYDLWFILKCGPFTNCMWLWRKMTDVGNDSSQFNAFVQNIFAPIVKYQRYSRYEVDYTAPSITYFLDLKSNESLQWDNQVMPQQHMGKK